MKLNDTFTSTGAKFFHHQEAMKNLRNGKGQPITTHVMATDVCAHTCAFCSVQARAGDVLPFDDIMAYLDILLKYSLKSVILSGGGNPILYRCKQSGRNFNDLVDAIHSRGLEIGLISDGMPLKRFSVSGIVQVETFRKSWSAVKPSTLDKLTWIRISMAGLDHEENEVFVPDINPEKTTLGFSYVGHDIFFDPAEPHHGKVSTEKDLVTLDTAKLKKPWRFEDRINELTNQFYIYASTYNPKYIRVLPNCLQPELIATRSKQLQEIADNVNGMLGHPYDGPVFVQSKPPKAPNVCLLGAIHPVLNASGFVFPCDSVVLSAAEMGYKEGKPNHAFDNAWAICHWTEIGKLYENELPKSLIKDTHHSCNGCVFSGSNTILEGVRNGMIEPIPPAETPVHANFV